MRGGSEVVGREEFWEDNGVENIGLDILGERGHGIGFAVDEECALDLAAGAADPVDEVVSVGMAGEPIEHIDLGIEREGLVADFDEFSAFGDTAAERAFGLVADDHDGVSRIGDGVFEMVADASGVAHPARGDDDHGAIEMADATGVFPMGGFVDVVGGEVLGFGFEDAPGFGSVGVGKFAMDFGEPTCEGGVDEYGDGADLVEFEEFLEAINHALGSAERESGDYDFGSEPDGACDDGVKLSDEEMSRIEFFRAIGAFADEDVNIFDCRGIWEETH